MGVSLDRLRDKILVMPFFVFLVVKFWNEEETFRVAMLCVLLLVEIFLVITGVYGLVKGLDVSAHKAGKIKMNLYFFLLFVWVFSIEPRLYEYSKHFNFLFTVSLFPTVYFAFGSLSGYVERFFPSSQK
jgi:phosphatidylglycerophosphate synthase